MIFCGLLLESSVSAQSVSPLPWWKEELHVQAEGGIVWRSPELVTPAQRIGTGMHTDGFWGIGGRVALGNTMLSLGWMRHKQSQYCTVHDLGVATHKNTTPLLSYTSLPLRIGQRFPLWSKRIAFIPHVSMVWSFMDEGALTQGGGSRSSGTHIDNNIGDTVYTTTWMSATVLQRNTFTLGAGAELTATFGRFTALAGLEYLWSDEGLVEYTVAYARTSTLHGYYFEQATIQGTPTVWAMRWGLLYRLWQPKEPEAGRW